MTTEDASSSALDADTARLDEAALWHMRLGDGAHPSDPEFAAWYADPANRAAFDEVASAWRLLDEDSATPEAMTMRGAALADAQRQTERGRPRRWPLRAIAAGLLVIALSTFGVFMLSSQPTTYVTTVGERRVITLPDGSRLSLDSATEVKARYTSRTRLLTLERGRSRFDVVQDATRPFIVEAQSERVLAVGTAFNVERLAGKVIVTLIEGKVTVTPTPSSRGGASTRAAVALQAGEQLVVAARSPPVVSPANLRAATAWEDGRLEFVDEPMSEVVARVNRYATNPIVLDPGVADLRISGVFKAGDVSGFVDAVTTYFPVGAAAEQGQVKLYAVRK
jgi:transmembrane sensor